jgi:hypothetical protein|tara:strand:- start:1017 stop:1406 length:390 start_codon:yes stop_codon:yes gene_type:complete
MKITAVAMGIMLVLSSPISADPIKPLFEKLLELDKSGFEGFSGYLFKSWLQFDEENPTFSLYINGIKYDVILDDGRGTSKTANDCPEENIFDEDPTTGCAINFDGEYHIERTGSSVEVKTKIWNVGFLE